MKLRTILLAAFLVSAAAGTPHSANAAAFQVPAAARLESGMPGSEEAFLDLKLAIRDQGYHLKRHAAHLIPRPTGSGALTAIQHLGPQDLVVMAYWSQSVEIEGIALYNHASRAAKWTAWTSLALQIRLAWARVRDR